MANHLKVACGRQKHNINFRGHNKNPPHPSRMPFIYKKKMSAKGQGLTTNTTEDMKGIMNLHLQKWSSSSHMPPQTFAIQTSLLKIKSDNCNLRNKIILINVNVLFLQSVQGFVIGISEFEKSLFYHANIFTVNLHRKDHSKKWWKLPIALIVIRISVFLTPKNVIFNWFFDL